MHFCFEAHPRAMEAHPRAIVALTIAIVYISSWSQGGSLSSRVQTASKATEILLPFCVAE
jgi:hypothetical protein